MNIKDKKLKEIKKARDLVVEIRSGGWLYNNVPPEVLSEIESAAMHLNLAISKLQSPEIE